MTLFGIEVIEELSLSDRHVLYRGRRDLDQQTVLVKTPRGNPPRVADVQSLEREFGILGELDFPGVPRVLEIVRQEETCGLIMEDRGGFPLPRLFDSLRHDPECVLKLGIKLSTILAELHRRDVIHRNLTSPGILVNPANQEVEIGDFLSASRPGGEATAPLPPTSFISSLAYISPEQTGRMNRGTDYRTDFYSLGVILYECLTGTLPFPATDPLELIHGHIAKIPPPPGEVNPEIPRSISDIVMKLLAKTAEERYQSAPGLKQDLSHCLQEWNSHHFIAPFPLGQHDVSDQFIIPQKLYGRDHEVKALVDAFDRTCGGPNALILVCGYSGIGKTSLIQELYKPIVRQRGYFITGKFDQIVRNIPHGALIQAFRGLIHQLLTESEERLSMFRSRLQEALGNNGGVIAEVLPEVELIVGKQTPVPALGPTEALNRFQMAFQNFVGALAQPEHPLVVFLDDLQWADAATLSLLQPFLTGPDVHHLLLIGAYRDNEVDEGHPLTRTLSALAQAGAQLHRVLLGPLKIGDLMFLIRDTLHGDLSEVAPLARLLLDKTGGNPFFVLQFLKMLRQEGFLKFDYELNRWNYQLEAIANAGMTDNVIDLMTRKIRKLSPQSQHALTLASCIGNTFDGETLAIISEQDPGKVAADLREAREEGLILSSADSFEVSEISVLDPPLPAAPTFTFLHDRVQLAAYSLIPEDRRNLVHLTVGRLLLNRGTASLAEEKIFDVVHHLNLGRNLIDDGEERVTLAKLNLDAGRKAKSSTAYQAALNYFNQGIALLEEGYWSSDYALMLGLHLERAESEYLCGDFQWSELHFEQLLKRAGTRLDKARVHSLRIVQYENMSRYLEAIASGREGLALFEVLFPDRTEEKEAALEAEVEAIQKLRGARTIDSLIDLPTMTDPEIRMVMKILTALWPSAYLVGDQLLTRLISATMVRLSLVHGNTEDSAYGYVTHAITVGPVRGDYKSGYEFGRLALSVNERFNDPRLRAKIHQQFQAHVNIWRRPMETCLPHSQVAFRSGFETGDFTYANYAVFSESWHALLISRDLGRFIRDYSPNLAVINKLKMTSFVDAQKIILNWARALQGLTRDMFSLSDETFNEEDYHRTYESNPFFMTFYHLAKLHLYFNLEEYGKATEAASHLQRVAHSLGGTIWPPVLDFWIGLTLASCYPLPGGPDRDRSLDQLFKQQESLRILAENCPENFRCFWLLLTAEIERLRGHTSEAMESYEKAIQYAREVESLQNSALGKELLAKFLLGRGRKETAAALLAEARDAYSKWGAMGKVRSMEQKHSDLLGEKTSARQPDFETGETASLDINSVLKASRAITVEIELDGLLHNLMKIALENAGARRGIFLREEEGRLVIEAEGALDLQEIRVRQSVPMEQSANLARAVVRYVRKTGESVVIDDATADERFANDPYIASVRPKSVLCVPVVDQGKLSGILYLENNLTSGAFTPGRIEMMRILSSTAAIALEKARLYEEMRHEVARRRSAEDELRLALAEVGALKNRLEAENVYLQEEIRREHDFEEIVGSSPALLDLLRNLEQVAPTTSTVLICGETGTGKELIARAIHNCSLRKDRPLVKVNCSAISAGLVESELFGHVKGAFTGALERRIGRFELADGGTIFLDEVGELPLETQVKLLRVLQEHEFEPVGSSRSVRVDVRVIAATNRDLEDAVQAGRFRSDLYYRLNVFPLKVPPLRDRQTDIPQLVMFFVSRYSKEFGKSVRSVAQETMHRLVHYSWPGNIRELQNIIERAVVLSQGSALALGEDFLPISNSHFAPSLSAEVPAASSLQGSPITSATNGKTLTLEEIERHHILTVLEEAGGVIEGAKGAAKLLNLHPNTLRSRMKKLGIRRSPHDIS
ncbi:MAG: sigma 54-interacting transcriptional regulator [Acidobacteriia bacterium]|nr:sigma 54-interacting transcriptional regulator [Terriglobia bacterium]